MSFASARLRLLASVLDAVIILGGMASVIGLGVAGAVAYKRVRGDGRPQGVCEEGDGWDGGEQDDRAGDPGVSPESDEWFDPAGDERADSAPSRHAPERFRQPLAMRAALWGAGAGVAVAGRNWRGPGFRVVGLRRVDARTGGTVSVRSALIGVVFDQAWQAGARRLFRSRVRRERNRMTALRPRLRAMNRKYANDPPARQKAVVEFYKANDVNALAGCGWQVAGSVGSRLILAAGERRGRSVRDRITGTGVIVDR